MASSDRAPSGGLSPSVVRQNVGDLPSVCVQQGRRTEDSALGLGLEKRRPLTLVPKLPGEDTSGRRCSRGQALATWQITGT